VSVQLNQRLETVATTRPLRYRVLVVEKIPLRLQVVGPGHINGEAVVDEGEQLAFDHRQLDVAAPELVRRPPVEKLLLDVNELVAGHVLKRQLVAEAQRLSIDEEGIGPAFVLDREIVAPRKELLFHYVPLQVSHPIGRIARTARKAPLTVGHPSATPENTPSTVQPPPCTPAPSCA